MLIAALLMIPTTFSQKHQNFTSRHAGSTIQPLVNTINELFRLPVLDLSALDPLMAFAWHHAAPGKGPTLSKNRAAKDAPAWRLKKGTTDDICDSDQGEVKILKRLVRALEDERKRNNQDAMVGNISRHWPGEDSLATTIYRSGPEEAIKKAHNPSLLFKQTVYGHVWTILRLVGGRIVAVATGTRNGVNVRTTLSYQASRLPIFTMAHSMSCQECFMVALEWTV
ncbi:hypothetical protein BT69DRAFT_870219 [Atractiella rhizophila]|nr:hypothetical protein BT69DRAFT_870219 [Atractiella rhizophila]